MFVDRDDSGTITAMYACQQRDDQEELPDDAADIAAFRHRFSAIAERAESDRTLVQGRIADLENSDDLRQQIEALKLRLSLIGG
jgi:hypothetical protein